MRSERRAADQRAKSKAKWIMTTLFRWKQADLTPRQVGSHAAFHCATGRHIWCGCSPRYGKDGPPARDLRKIDDAE